jgi:hypothetical protein
MIIDHSQSGHSGQNKTPLPSRIAVRTHMKSGYCNSEQSLNMKCIASLAGLHPRHPRGHGQGQDVN